MKDKGLASVLIELLQTWQRSGSTQILISTEATDGVTYLTMKDDGIEVFEIESKYLNANKEIKIEQNSVTQETCCFIKTLEPIGKLGFPLASN